MPTSEQGCVVRVPFPYTDRETRRYRPAVVVSRGALGSGPHLVWVVMVTSARHRPWPGDVSLEERYGEASLPAPSVVRTAKIATVDAARTSLLGRLPADVWSRVEHELRRHLGWEG